MSLLTLTNLPSEVIDAILENFSLPAEQALLAKLTNLGSKSLLMHAVPLLYRSPRFDNPQTWSLFVNTIISEAASGEDRRRYAVFVKSLRVTNVRHCTNPDLVAVANMTTSINEVDLRGCSFLTGSSMAAFSSHGTLERVFLGSNRGFNDGTIKELVTKCRLCLHTLHLEGLPNITHESIRHITTLLPKPLKHLYISRCREITDTALQKIAKHEPFYLEHLSLNPRHGHSTELRFLELAQSCTRLREFRVTLTFYVTIVTLRNFLTLCADLELVWVDSSDVAEFYLLRAEIVETAAIGKRLKSLSVAGHEMDVAACLDVEKANRMAGGRLNELRLVRYGDMTEKAFEAVNEALENKGRKMRVVTEMDY